VKLAGGDMDGSCKNLNLNRCVVFADVLKLRKLPPNRRGLRDSQHASLRVALIQPALSKAPPQPSLGVLQARRSKKGGKAEAG
jgi:hypothetical protein